MVPTQHIEGPGPAGGLLERSRPDAMPRNQVAFALLVFVEVWLAHAFIFFAHEYSHSCGAWASGFKANPLLLHFGDLSFWNLLVMIKIDENVDYGPIFASGNGALAALIAAAGALSAAPLYVISLLGYRASGGRKIAKMFFVLLCLMCVGNFIDYVPTRTFSPAGDMYLLEKGLGLGPWVVVLGLGAPFLVGVLHFFLKLLPAARQDLFPAERGRQAALVVVSTFLFFVFFGAAGLESGAGIVANRLSLLFIFGGFPIATIALWPRRAKPV